LQCARGTISVGRAFTKGGINTNDKNICTTNLTKIKSEYGVQRFLDKKLLVPRQHKIRGMC